MRPFSPADLSPVEQMALAIDQSLRATTVLTIAGCGPVVPLAPRFTTAGAPLAPLAGSERREANAVSKTSGVSGRCEASHELKKASGRSLAQRSALTRLPRETLASDAIAPAPVRTPWALGCPGMLLLITCEFPLAEHIIEDLGLSSQ